MEPIHEHPAVTPYSFLNSAFAILLSILSWAFALAQLQSVLSLLLTLASLVWVVVQIRSHLASRTIQKKDPKMDNHLNSPKTDPISGSPTG